MPETPADPVAAALARIKAVTDAATKGPWRAEPNTGAGRVWVQIGARRGEADCEPLFNVRTLRDARRPEDERRECRQREADAVFIVAARLYLPQVMAALEAVLELHQPQPGVLPPMCSVCQTEWDDSRDDWPCKTYQAISRGLLGEDGA